MSAEAMTANSRTNVGPLDMAMSRSRQPRRSRSARCGIASASANGRAMASSVAK